MNSIKYSLFGLMALAVVACTPTATTDLVYTQVSTPVLQAGATIPTPTNEVILTVTGAIGAANSDGAILMDLATIESVGLVDYTVTDPFEKREITYRGVLMSDLIKLWQVSSTATTLNVVALNDYAVDVPLADINQYPIIFALQADGVYMPVSTRGPAMLVYPYDDFTFDPAIYNDYWIWQIKSIDVR